MPASPIVKEVTPPENWEKLEKMITPDSATDCYWSVWFNEPTNMITGTAWLMYCPFGDDPTINDNWSHAEEITGDCKNVLDTIKSVYGISFHEYIIEELPSE